MTAPSPNTHRAVIEYAVPPSLQPVASGSREFCFESLTKYIAGYPNATRPYDDQDLSSGGIPRILAVDGAQYPLDFAAISHAYDNDPAYHAHVRLLLDWLRHAGYTLTDLDGHTS